MSGQQSDRQNRMQNVVRSIVDHVQLKPWQSRISTDTHPLADIDFVVARNLAPAIFSTAILIPKPTNPVSRPSKKTNVHFRNTYSRISCFVLDRQSCRNNSFSINLRIRAHHPDISARSTKTCSCRRSDQRNLHLSRQSRHKAAPPAFGWSCSSLLRTEKYSTIGAARGSMYMETVPTPIALHDATTVRYTFLDHPRTHLSRRWRCCQFSEIGSQMRNLTI